MKRALSLWTVLTLAAAGFGQSPEIRTTISLAPPPQPAPADPELASMISAAATEAETDPAFATIPATTVPIDINWCNPQAVAALPAELRSFEFCSETRPLTACNAKSVPGVAAVEICGSLSEFRTRGYIRVGGSLDASFYVAPARVDPGSPAVYSPCNRTPDPCLIKGFCIAGAPVVTRAAQPAVYYPCNTYAGSCVANFCIVGAPVVVDTDPFTVVTCRLVKEAVPAVTETCRLITPAKPPSVVPPSLANLRLTGARLIDSRLTHTVRGNAGVEIDVAIPSLGVIVKDKNDNTPGFSLGTEFLAGLFLHLEGQARGAQLTLDGGVDARGTIDLDWNPARGWVDRGRVTANRWTAGLQLTGPEQIELLAALRSTLAGELALQFQNVDVVKAALGGYFGPYLKDDWTRPPNRNWRHDIDAGLGTGYDAALSIFAGNFLLPDLRLLSASADAEIAKANIADYFGRGDLEVRLSISGQPAAPLAVSLKMAPLPASSGTGIYISPPELRYTGLLSSATRRFSQHPLVADFAAPCIVDSLPPGGARPAARNCELVAEEYLLSVTLPNNCSLRGNNPRRLRLRPEESITEALEVTCGGTATPPPGTPPVIRPRLLPRPSTLAFHYQPGGPAPLPQAVAVFGERADYNVVVSKSGGVNWLAATPASGTTPGSLRVSVLPAGLRPGYYVESIYLESPSAPGAGFEIPVTLTVATNVRPLVAPAEITLETIAGAAAPLTTILSVTSNGVGFNLNVAAMGAAWLSTNWTRAGVGIPGSAPTRIAVTANPAGLEEGTYHGSVRLTAVEGDAVTVPVTLIVRSNRLAISQVADGDNWKTTIILVNTDNGPAPFTIRFYDQNGQPAAIELEGIGKLSEYSATILPSGSHVIETSGTSPTLVQGWAEVTAGRSIAGRAIFRQRSPAGADSEAAVPLGWPSNGPVFLAFDNTQGFVTSAALLNSHPSEAAAVTLRFRDPDGQSISTETLNLGPRSREAFALPERFPAVARRNGAVEITSSGGELSVLGLRFNPRSSFTSLEATAPQAVGGDTITRSVSQIADGDNWKTTIVLVNSGAEPATFALTFRRPDGALLAVPVVGLGALSEMFETIPAGGSRTIETQGASSTLVQGWAEIVTSGSLGGTAVFRQRREGGTDYEGVVQIAPPLGSRFLLPFDNTRGFVTAMAALNGGISPATATITFREEEGETLSVETLTLAPNNRIAFALPDRFPSTAGRRGTAEFTGGDITVLGLRFNPLGAFTSMAPVKR